MQDTRLTDDIFYIGVDDKTIDLFEGQYVVPNGMSYNSYLIRDEQVAVMDTVDARETENWLNHLEHALAGRTPDYLVVLHMEPDHAGSMAVFLKKYPNARVVATAKTFAMIPQFFEDLDLSARQLVVGEGDTLSLGRHTLRFVMAPMVHWPEVMMAYDMTDKVLFSADAFGKFGALDADEDWTCEARRYYINIVGKFGPAVQTLLKKAATLDIQKIFPLHGPFLTENLPYYLNKYDIWSSYRPEDKGVFIAYNSVYGHTKVAVLALKSRLEQAGIKVSLSDLARDDMAEALEDAFRYDRMVVAATTYEGGLFPAVEAFLTHLKSKNYQNRTVALIENGSWAPQAALRMRDILAGMKNIRLIEPTLTIRSALKSGDEPALGALAQALIEG